MKFTFGIITYDGSTNPIEDVIQSIIKLEIPEYEIVVVGGPDRSDITHIPFDETQRAPLADVYLKEPYRSHAGWLTRKKNLITEAAMYDNIVYMHDYFSLDPNWYKGYTQFGDDWEVCMNVILNANGKRYRDWCAWDDPILPGEKRIGREWGEMHVSKGGHGLMPYDCADRTQYMYISGGYWVAKKQFMLDNPLNEQIGQFQGDDVEWCYRIRQKYDYKMNQHSTTRLLIQKPMDWKEYTV
jgi:hypothetical protein